MLHIIFNNGNLNGYNVTQDAAQEEDAAINPRTSRDSNYINIYPPNYKFHPFLNGNIQLQILLPSDPTKCYRYFQDKKTHRCLKCKNKNFHNTASLEKDVNGIEYIKMKAEHICEPSKYYDSRVLKYANFEHYIEQFGAEEYIFGGELFIFTDFTKSAYYRFYYDKQKNYYVCAQCNTLKKLTEAIVKLDEDGENYVEAESIHACQPVPYIPKIKPPNYAIRQNGSRLIIFADSCSSLCYQYSWDKKRKAYICLSCSKKGKYIKAKIWKAEESDAKFVQLYDFHECEPVPFTT